MGKLFWLLQIRPLQTCTTSIRLGGGAKKFSELPYQGLPCLQELGTSTTSPISQYAASAATNPAFYTNSGKINPFIKEIYISGAYNGTPASELGLYIIRAGCTINEAENDRSIIFIYFADKNGNNIIQYQTADDVSEKNSLYHKKVQNGLTLEFISRLPESPYDWNSSPDDIEASTLTDRAFNIDFSPTIKAIHNAENITELDRVQKQFQFVIDNGVNKVAAFIKELYISSDEINLTDVTFIIFKLFKYTSTGNSICCGLTIKSSINESGWYFEIPGTKTADGEYTGLVGSGYYCFTTSNGINFELVIDWENNPYNFNDTLDSEVITRYAYNIDYSPTIKQQHYAINEVAKQYDNDGNDFNLIKGYLKQDGTLNISDDENWYIVTDYIPLKSIYDIEFRCAYQWNLSYCCLYDINKNFLKSYVPLGNVSNLTYIEGKMSELTDVPANAAYAVFCTIVNGKNGVEGAYIRSSKVEIDKSNPLKGKKGYFIGDSIMIGHDDVETTLSITKFLTDKYGMECVNKARGGAILTSSTKHYAPIYQMLTSIPNDADYIIMQGGVNGMTKEASEDAPWGWGEMSADTNDMVAPEDIINQIPCLENMCQYVISHFPNAKYGFIITYKISSWADYWKEKSELVKQVLEKWGIPYLDWRQTGVNLASLRIREQYGVDAFASYEEYSSEKTYNVDDRVLNEGNAYKCNTAISTPEEFNPEHWDLISETRYDGWHCNAKAYKELADKTAAWMKSL